MRCALRVSVFVIVSTGVILGVGPRVQGALIYLNIPSIAGEDPTPGYPGAIAVNPLNVAANSFSIQKTIDKATPKLQAAVVGGTPLGTVSALFYNAAPSGPPDAILPFENVFASSQALGPGLAETDGFAATTPDSIYLEVSGITGEASTPGHPGVMRVDSLEMSGNRFIVGRQTDTATPQIFSAVVLGNFHTASLLFYNSAPSGPPDVELDFSDVIASSFMPISSGDVPRELDGFNYSHISQPTPEPGTVVLALIGAAVCGAKYGRRRLSISRGSRTASGGPA